MLASSDARGLHALLPATQALDAPLTLQLSLEPDTQRFAWYLRPP